jgi:hypothetical protein
VQILEQYNEASPHVGMDGHIENKLAKTISVSTEKSLEGRFGYLTSTRSIPSFVFLLNLEQTTQVSFK